jgi:hypothetical protein
MLIYSVKRREGHELCLRCHAAKICTVGKRNLSRSSISFVALKSLAMISVTWLC